MGAAMLGIRTATLDDADRLSEFARRTFHETFAAHNTPEDMEWYLSRAFGHAQQVAEIQDQKRVTLLGEDGGRLVGYAQLHLSAVPTSVPDDEAIELVRFYVDGKWHGRGVARMLMDAVDEAAATHAKTMWLGVWERNHRAIAFYRKCGFVDVGSHVFHLGDDLQTDRIMWRPVNAAALLK
jgi:diamine N-acetyltransferase